MQIYFWNIADNNANLDLIVPTIHSEPNSIFAVAEPWSVTDALLLSKGILNFWRDPYNRTLVLFGTLIQYKWISKSDYYSVFEIAHEKAPFLLYVLHLKSKLNGESAAETINTLYIAQIKEEIASQPNNNVVVIGDFNHSYFEHPLIKTEYFNNTNYFSEDEKTHKKIGAFEAIKYYNPIAALYGDRSGQPIGTYYRSTPNQSQSWLILDQALVSYSFALHLDKHGCQILNSLNGVRLDSNRGIPKREYSDHFPIKIKLN